MDAARRRFVRGMTGIGACGIAGLLGLSWPRTAPAAWPQQAFTADTLTEAVKGITGMDTPPVPSDAIEIQAPVAVDTGTMVPVEVSTLLPRVESIVLLADGNPYPLISSFQLSAGVLPYIYTCVELVETSNLIAVVKAEGRLFSASRPIQVAQG